MSAQAVIVGPAVNDGHPRDGAVGSRGTVLESGASEPPAPSLDTYRISPPSCERIRLVDQNTGETIGVPCKSWKCDACSITNRRAFLKRLRMGLAEDRTGELPKLLTLTSSPGEHPAASRQHLTRRFENLRRIVARQLPGMTARLEYVGVPEVTRAGALHFHVVLRGVPYIPQSVWSTWAQRAGFGYIVDIRKVRSREGMGAYLAKSLGAYLTKQLASPAWAPHFRRIRFSRAYATGWVPRSRRERPDGAWALLRVEPWMESRSEPTLAALGPP